MSPTFQKLLAMLKNKGNPNLAGIGANGPHYNPGAEQQFQPGPMPEVPFMPQAQVGPQSIGMGDYSKIPNLGLPSGPQPNPNNVPGAAGMEVPGQTAAYNQQPGTFQGPASGNANLGGKQPFGPDALAAYLKIIGGKKPPEPMQWLQMNQNRWGS